MKRVMVLGSGMVGSVIAADLVAGRDEGDAFEVTVADRSDEALARVRTRCGDKVRTVKADLSDPARVTELVRGFDAAAGALASHLGFAALRAVIEAGTPYCDISFMPQDAWELDAFAAERGVPAVVDFGVAPGMSNVLAAHGARMLDEAHEIDMMVGGLPVERMLPFEYKAGFAPADVIEEYTLPARLVEGGRVVVRPALSGIEPIDFPGVGTLEAFNTDGLRSLAYTLKVPFMRERTLRYPGHAALMRAFREAGLFGTEPVDVEGGRVRPLDVTSRVLFPKWTYEDGEADLTALRVDVRGARGGKHVQLRWDLLDRYDPEARTTSMARTTAFPCALMIRELAGGTLRTPGVLVPERATEDAALLKRLLAGLERRGITFAFTESAWTPGCG